jgi:2-iminoacetate synthase
MHQQLQVLRFQGQSILRVTLSLEEVIREAQALKNQEFPHVSRRGEHPKFVSHQYLADCVRVLHGEFLSVCWRSDRWTPKTTATSVRREQTVWWFTRRRYDRAITRRSYVGPKHFDWRLKHPNGPTPPVSAVSEWARSTAGDWRLEAIMWRACEYLLRHCWKAQLTISVPRLRPHAGDFQPPAMMPDRELVQLICAFV